jgi:hypothetical protein
MTRAAAAFFLLATILSSATSARADGRARSPRLQKSTRILLEHLEADDYVQAPRLLGGNLHRIVMDKAQGEGLRVVKPADAQRLLLVHLAETQGAVKSRAYQRAADPRDGHGEVVMDAMKHGYDSTWGHRFIQGFADQDVQRLHDTLSSPELPLAALRDAARRDGGTRLWVAATRQRIGRIHGMTGTERATALDGLAKDLEQLAPASVWTPLLARAKAGDALALNELQHTVRQYGGRRTTLAVSETASRAVQAMQKNLRGPSMPELYKWSGDINFYILTRNLRTFAETVRDQAYFASAERRPMRILEMTHGLPRTALELTEPERARRHGDYFIYYTPPGNGYGQRGIPHEAPFVESTVITPHNLLSEPAIADAPHEFRKWYDAELAGEWPEGREYPVATIQRRISTLEQAGRFKVIEGDMAGRLREQVRAGKRYDLITANEVAWTADRVNVLASIQHALSAKGRGFVPLEWWSPRSLGGKGVNEFVHFADRVRLKNGREMALEDYLSERFPDAFEVSREAGTKTLLVKGTSKPVTIPPLDPVAVSGEVRHGFPVMTWQER